MRPSPCMRADCMIDDLDSPRVAGVGCLFTSSFRQGNCCKNVLL